MRFAVLFALLLSACATTSGYGQEVAFANHMKDVREVAKQYREIFSDLQGTIGPMYGDLELACAHFGDNSGNCVEMTRLWALEREQAAIVDKLLAHYESTGQGFRDLQGALNVLRDVMVDIFIESGRVRAAVRTAAGRTFP